MIDDLRILGSVAIIAGLALFNSAVVAQASSLTSRASAASPDTPARGACPGGVGDLGLGSTALQFPAGAVTLAPVGLDRRAWSYWEAERCVNLLRVSRV